MSGAVIFRPSLLTYDRSPFLCVIGHRDLRLSMTESKLIDAALLSSLETPWLLVTP